MDEDKDFFSIEINDSRRRAELTIPFMITYHHLDTWLPALGRDVFTFWLQLFTFANRKDYQPRSNIVEYSYNTMAEKVGVSKGKLTNMLKTLYEYGLLEITEVKNRFGGIKQVYKVCIVPEYSDTAFCELKKYRKWEDRQSAGQKLNATLSLKRHHLSQFKNRTGLDKPSQSKNRTGASSKIEPEPVQNLNYINNNNINNYNLKQQQQQNDTASDRKENEDEKEVVVAETHNANKQAKIESLAAEILKVTLMDSTIDNLLEYEIPYIREKMLIAANRNIENVDGWLITACRKDYRLNPRKVPEREQRENLEAIELDKKYQDVYLS